MASYDSRKLIERITKKANAKIRKRFGLIIDQIRREHGIDALAEMIAVGDVEGALSMLDAAAKRLADSINSIFLVAGEEFAEEISTRLGISISFDHTNARVVDLMAQNKLELVRNFTKDQRQATRQALTEGVREGINPRAMAREFRDSIGLTPKQQRAVSNFRRLLKENDATALNRALRDGRFDKTVERAIKEGRALTKAELDRMVERYRERMLKYRSEVIARTEAIPAVNAAHDEAVRQGVDSGVLDRSKIQRTWKSAKDERVRDFKTGANTSHRTMHNQVRGFDQPFLSGGGNLLRYPGDHEAPPEDRIQCRCVVATRIAL